MYFFILDNCLVSATAFLLSDDDNLLHEQVYLEAVLVKAIPGAGPDRHLLRVVLACIAGSGPVEVDQQGTVLDLATTPSPRKKNVEVESSSAKLVIVALWLTASK